MIRIAIVEDERESRNALKGMIERFFEGKENDFSVAEFGDGMNFIADYSSVYDIVFMDIEMPFMNGMTAAEKLREIDTNVKLVFVTHLARYAVQGYTVDAVGYLLKPLEYFPFERLMKKLTVGIKPSEDSIIVKTAQWLVKLEWDSVRYIEVMDHYLVFHSESGDHRTYGKLIDVERQMPSSGFFKCGKSFIVNLRHVKSVTRTGVLIGGEEVPVSRARRTELLKAFGEYIRGIK